MLTQIAVGERLDAAFEWLCQRRSNSPANADVWWFRQDWTRQKNELRAALRTGNFRFAPLSEIDLKTGEQIEMWSARDALVLKLLSWELASYLPASHRCTHLKGHGGAKYAVREVMKHLPENRFLMRTDVKSYYASIDHFLLLEQLAEYVKDRDVMNLLAQYLRRCVERGGVYREIKRGICRGCPLSPLIGAFFLYTLDVAMERTGLFYVRFMDDIMVLAPTRCKLRKAVKVVNTRLAALKLDKHPDKTFIGRIDKGFDFLGYHFSPAGLSLADQSIANFIERATRLYEQERGDDSPRLRVYVQRWCGWVVTGIPPDFWVFTGARLHHSA